MFSSAFFTLCCCYCSPVCRFVCVHEGVCVCVCVIVNCPGLSPCVPWCNCTGWLGVKHQFTHLLSPWVVDGHCGTRNHLYCECYDCLSMSESLNNSVHCLSMSESLNNSVHILAGFILTSVNGHSLQSCKYFSRSRIQLSTALCSILYFSGCWIQLSTVLCWITFVAVKYNCQQSCVKLFLWLWSTSLSS